MLKVDGITETASALSTISDTLDFPFGLSVRELLSSLFLRSLSSLSLSRDLLLSVLLLLFLVQPSLSRDLLLSPRPLLFFDLLSLSRDRLLSLRALLFLLLLSRLSDLLCSLLLSLFKSASSSQISSSSSSLALNAFTALSVSRGIGAEPYDTPDSWREWRFLSLSLSPSVRREVEDTMDLSSLLLRRWRRRRDAVDAVSSTPTVLPRSLRPPKAAFHILADGRGAV